MWVHRIPTDVGPGAKRGLSQRLMRLNKRRVSVGVVERVW